MSLTMHTDAPSPLLRRMASREEAHLELGATTRGKPDCIYGWMEPQDRPECKQHLMVSLVSDDLLQHMGVSLIQLGYQVVIVDDDSAQPGEPVAGMPHAYDWAHQH